VPITACRAGQDHACVAAGSCRRGGGCPGRCWVFSPEELGGCPRLSEGPKNRTPLPSGHPHPRRHPRELPLTIPAHCGRSGSKTRSPGSCKRSIQNADVGIYACGPTVYSRIHIGNARAVSSSSSAAWRRSSSRRDTRAKPGCQRPPTSMTRSITRRRLLGSRSAEFAERMTRGLFRGQPIGLGLGAPRCGAVWLLRRSRPSLP